MKQTSCLKCINIYRAGRCCCCCWRCRGRGKCTLPSGVTGPEYGACSPISTGQMSKNSWKKSDTKNVNTDTNSVMSQAEMQDDAVPSPWSCPVNRQSSGRSWGRLAPCTRLCETVARCPSALQTPCWPTTAATARQKQKKNPTHISRHAGRIPTIKKRRAPYLSFACLAVVEVIQVVDLQVQGGEFQIL